MEEEYPLTDSDDMPIVNDDDGYSGGSEDTMEE